MIDIIVKTSWENDENYRDFVLEKSENGTIYHLPDFLSYHQSVYFKNTEKYFIKFIKNNKIIAGILGVVKEENQRKQFISPFGASYGGLVMGVNLNYYEYETIYNLLFTYLQTISNSVKITPTIAIHSSSQKSSYHDYILLSKGAIVLMADLLLVHTLDDNDKIIKRIDKKTATELNQPLKKNNLKLQVIDNVDEETYSLLFNSQQRKGSVPTHTLQELNLIEKIVPNTIKSFKIIYENRLVAGIIVFYINKKVLNTFYIFDDGLEARDVKANHFSYFSVLKWAKDNNYHFLDFGPSSFGFIPNYSLIKFKEKFNAHPSIRYTYNILFN